MLVSRTISKACGTTRCQEETEYASVSPCIEEMSEAAGQALVELLVYLVVIRDVVELTGVVREHGC